MQNIKTNKLSGNFIKRSFPKVAKKVLYKSKVKKNIQNIFENSTVNIITNGFWFSNSFCLFQISSYNFFSFRFSTSKNIFFNFYLLIWKSLLRIFFFFSYNTEKFIDFERFFFFGNFEFSRKFFIPKRSNKFLCNFFLLKNFWVKKLKKNLNIKLRKKITKKIFFALKFFKQKFSFFKKKISFSSYFLSLFFCFRFLFFSFFTFSHSSFFSKSLFFNFFFYDFLRNFFSDINYFYFLNDFSFFSFIYLKKSHVIFDVFFNVSWFLSCFAFKGFSKKTWGGFSSYYCLGYFRLLDYFVLDLSYSIFMLRRVSFFLIFSVLQGSNVLFCGHHWNDSYLENFTSLVSQTGQSFICGWNAGSLTNIKRFFFEKFFFSYSVTDGFSSLKQNTFFNSFIFKFFSFNNLNINLKFFLILRFLPIRSVFYFLHIFFRYNHNKDIHNILFFLSRFIKVFFTLHFKGFFFSLLLKIFNKFFFLHSLTVQSCIKQTASTVFISPTFRENVSFFRKNLPVNKKFKVFPRRRFPWKQDNKFFDKKLEKTKNDKKLKQPNNKLDINALFEYCWDWQYLSLYNHYDYNWLAFFNSFSFSPSNFRFKNFFLHRFASYHRLRYLSWWKFLKKEVRTQNLRNFLKDKKKTHFILKTKQNWKSRYNKRSQYFLRKKYTFFFKKIKNISFFSWFTGSIINSFFKRKESKFFYLKRRPYENQKLLKNEHSNLQKTLRKKFKKKFRYDKFLASKGYSNIFLKYKKYYYLPHLLKANKLWFKFFFKFKKRTALSNSNKIVRNKKVIRIKNKKARSNVIKNSTSKNEKIKNKKINKNGNENKIGNKKVNKIRNKKSIKSSLKNKIWRRSIRKISFTLDLFHVWRKRYFFLPSFFYFWKALLKKNSRLNLKYSFSFWKWFLNIFSFIVFRFQRFASIHLSSVLRDILKFRYSFKLSRSRNIFLNSSLIFNSNLKDLRFFFKKNKRVLKKIYFKRSSPSFFLRRFNNILHNKLPTVFLILNNGMNSIAGLEVSKLNICSVAIINSHERNLSFTYSVPGNSMDEDSSLFYFILFQHALRKGLFLKKKDFLTLIYDKNS